MKYILATAILLASTIVTQAHAETMTMAPKAGEHCEPGGSCCCPCCKGMKMQGEPATPAPQQLNPFSTLNQ